MDSMLASNARDLDLRQLRAFQVLLREHNLTRAAAALDVTQPALSKTLAQLRNLFSDPLFIRVGHKMEPTSKALELAPAVGAILDQVTTLRSRHVPFDAAQSTRTFTFCVVDAGLIRLLPPLIRYLHAHAPKVSLRVAPLEIEKLEASLESGKLDFAMGSYPSLSKKIRRQFLFTVSYASVVRRDHPRIKSKPTLAAFTAEKHVLVSAAGTGHAHQQAERALETIVPSQNITCRVPMFVTAAVIASMTDAVVTLPASLATTLAEQLGLRVVTPPVKLPRIEVSQHWHERFHREPGSVWIRGVFVELFGERR
jgi:DNA-binding transcriptional LysR family regulator